MSRVMLVSNRLPITIHRDSDRLRFERSSGGLATGLRPTHERDTGIWVGWPGSLGQLSGEQRQDLQAQLAARRLAPVFLQEADERGFYEGYCNGLLWPLFHSFLGQIPLETPDFSPYQRANERFAEEVLRTYQPGDRIWVHDYQLMLLPRLLRERLPEARIGFFLHIPFPPLEIFRSLPEREALLDGVLAADLVGFHTASYARNFATSALHVLGASMDVERLSWRGGSARVRAFPMGVDARYIEEKSAAIGEEQRRTWLQDREDVKLLVGIDRLDYTKGIPRRLLSFERLLSDRPEFRGKVRLIQVAIPSRTGVGAYAEFRNQVHALVGRINGRFASPDWVPVHYLYRSIEEDEMLALYRAASVMLVTPIRDGMNLVAKEFVASRVEEQGVLVLSEFAGAAADLAEAILINPYDIDGCAHALAQALAMPEQEQRARMRAMRARVLEHDVQRWACSFLEEIEERGRQTNILDAQEAPRGELEKELLTVVNAPRVLVLLDYDGTLVPIQDRPSLATPDQELLALLRRLAERPSTEVHIVSGRDREDLGAWLGELPVHLHAEHGYWSRTPGEPWTTPFRPATSWRPRALAILRGFTGRTPGALLEEKSSCLAWHYRMADPKFGEFQANELRLHLSTLLSNEPVEVLSGHKVIELRPIGANKGAIAAGLIQRARPGTASIAFGDDRTDEDLFAALPDDALTFHVGTSPSCARFRLRSVQQVRKILEGLAAHRPG
jgi:trehalose 6-phosphate synthase/phosphatase